MEVNLVPPVPLGNTGVAACMVVPEILKEGNYERWCIFMEHYLVAQDLWDVVSIDQSPIENPRDWVKKNALALHTIKISCEATSFDRIKKMNLAQEAWNALADMHKQPKEVASRGSEADTGENFTHEIEVNWSNKSVDSYIELNKKEVKETWTRILENNERTKILSSLHDGNWNALKKLDRITEIVFPCGFTVLHVASMLGHLKIVEELMKIKGEDYLEIKDKNGDTALSLAACKGIVKIAKCLAMKNDKLLYIPNNKGYVPLVVACINRQKDLASYLYSITKFEFLVSEKDKQGTLFLKYCVLNFMPDVGLDLFLRCPRLAASEESITISDLALQPSLFYSGAFLSFPFDMLLYKCLNVVELPTPSDKAVSRRKLEIFKRQVALVEVLGGRYIIRLGKLRRIYYLKLTHKYANLVLRHWCKEISTYTDAKQLVESGAISVIYQAIKDGTLEIVVEILKANPDLIWCNEELTRKMIIMAIKYRRGSLLTFGYKLDAGKKALLSLGDKDGNNALHMVAKLPVYPYDSVGIHAAWAMIREERWFEEIKSYLPCWSHEAKNRYGETPDQVFYREHQQLITNMEEWGKKTAKSYSIASVLIVTIMFAALFTVPGGIDEKTGMPKLWHIKELSGFLICDAVSFITASTSFFGFLSVLTLTYKRSGPRGALPFQMLFAISTLSISIATMILAFIFALVMMLEKKWRLLPALMIYLLVVFYFLLSDWQIPKFLSLFFMMVFNPSSYLDRAYGRQSV